MARTASRSRTAAFLSRTVRLRPAPAGPQPAAARRGPFRLRGGGAKDGSKGPAKTGAKARRTGTKTKAKAKGSTRPASQPARAERRPLPLPLRVLAMLCAFVFMVAFAVVLAKLTLEPSPASVALTHTNLHPGRSLKAYLDQPALRDAVKQVGGNVLLGVPFGVLVPVLAPRARGLLRVLLLTATVMLLVEFAQGALITGRAFDIDDVILNTGGALVGYLLLGRRLGRAVHARKRRQE
ncbi:VanZ family protein [Streptomyces sp. NPDC059582]|uniref:VanZ family protein n=1 Tax=Streptomyces sp. NPDC059582 TaxID=3346875 RepID=UPI003679861B